MVEITLDPPITGEDPFPTFSPTIGWLLGTVLNEIHFPIKDLLIMGS